MRCSLLKHTCGNIGLATLRCLSVKRSSSHLPNFTIIPEFNILLVSAYLQAKAIMQQNGFGRQPAAFFQGASNMNNRFQQNNQNRGGGGMWQNPPQPFQRPQQNVFQQQQQQQQQQPPPQQQQQQQQGNAPPAVSGVQARLGPARTPITAPAKNEPPSNNRPVLLRPGQERAPATKQGG